MSTEIDRLGTIIPGVTEASELLTKFSLPKFTSRTLRDYFEDRSMTVQKLIAISGEIVNAIPDDDDNFDANSINVDEIIITYGLDPQSMFMLNEGWTSFHDFFTSIRDAAIHSVQLDDETQDLYSNCISLQSFADSSVITSINYYDALNQLKDLSIAAQAYVSGLVAMGKDAIGDRINIFKSGLQSAFKESFVQASPIVTYVQDQLSNSDSLKDFLYNMYVDMGVADSETSDSDSPLEPLNTRLYAYTGYSVNPLVGINTARTAIGSGLRVVGSVIWGVLKVCAGVIAQGANWLWKQFGKVADYFSRMTGDPYDIKMIDNDSDGFTFQDLAIVNTAETLGDLLTDYSVMNYLGTDEELLTISKQFDLVFDDPVKTNETNETFRKEYTLVYSLKSKPDPNACFSSQYSFGEYAYSVDVTNAMIPPELEVWIVEIFDHETNSWRKRTNEGHLTIPFRAAFKPAPVNVKEFSTFMSKWFRFNANVEADSSFASGYKVSYNYRMTSPSKSNVLDMLEDMSKVNTLVTTEMDELSFLSSLYCGCIMASIVLRIATELTWQAIPAWQTVPFCNFMHTEDYSVDEAWGVDYTFAPVDAIRAPGTESSGHSFLTLQDILAYFIREWVVETTGQSKITNKMFFEFLTGSRGNGVFVPGLSGFPGIPPLESKDDLAILSGHIYFLYQVHRAVKAFYPLDAPYIPYRYGRESFSTPRYYLKTDEDNANERNKFWAVMFTIVSTVLVTMAVGIACRKVVTSFTLKKGSRLLAANAKLARGERLTRAERRAYLKANSKSKILSDNFKGIQGSEDEEVNTSGSSIQAIETEISQISAMISPINEV